MGYQNNLLLRTNLKDEGVIGKRNFSYSSPDIISHNQVADPENYFKNTYNQDLNMPIEVNNNINYVYARAKNLAEKEESGYLWIYRSSASLFMTPSRWRNNKLYTGKGASSTLLRAGSRNELVVTPDPYILNGLQNSYYCMVSIITDTPKECVPDDFASYDQFNYWVRTNMGVAVRNFNKVYGTDIYDFQRLDSLTNPEDVDVASMMKVIWTGLPVGYTVGVRCDALPDLEKSVVTTSENGSFATATMVPAGFEGYIETFAHNGDHTASFPAGATIETEFRTEVTLKNKCFEFGQTLTELGFEPAEHIGLSASSKLILTGACGTSFC